MEELFLIKLIQSSQTPLLEKFKLYAPHSTTFRYDGASAKALIAELEKYNFAERGSTREILEFCDKLNKANAIHSLHVAKAVTPFLKIETLTLTEIVQEVKNWSYQDWQFSLWLCAAFDWTKHKKEKVLELAKKADSKPLWLHLINSGFANEEDLDMLLFGQKVEKPELIHSETMGFRFTSKVPSMNINIYLTEMLFRSEKLSVSYKKKILQWESSNDDVFKSCKAIFSNGATEKDVIEIVDLYGNCTWGETNIAFEAMRYLTKFSNLMKAARKSKSAQAWEFLNKKAELYKQPAQRVLRVAKVSGHPEIWKTFFGNEDAKNVSVTHEELLRIGKKFKQLGLWSVLLNHTDYKKVTLDWVFDFVKVCNKELIPHMQRICKKKYYDNEAYRCLEAISKNYDWGQVSYEKKIEALKLQERSVWQDPIINSMERIELSDFLELVKNNNVSKKLQDLLPAEAI